MDDRRRTVKFKFKAAGWAEKTQGFELTPGPNGFSVELEPRE